MSIMGCSYVSNILAVKCCKHKAKILLAFHCQIVQNHSMWHWNGDRPDVPPRPWTDGFAKEQEHTRPSRKSGKPRKEQIGRKTERLSSQATAEAISMRQCGLTYQQIGAALGCTRQRAQQLVRPAPLIRLAIAREAGHRCQDCGAPELDGHIHHRDDRAADYNARTNLAYLCIVCHRHRHTK